MAATMSCADDWLLRLLTSKGLLGEDGVRALRRGEPHYASRELLRLKLLTKRQLAEAVEGQYGIAFAEPDLAAPDKLAVSLVPESLCRKHMLFPLRLSGETLELLMVNPLDVEALDAVNAVSGRRSVPFFGLPDRIEGLLSTAYGSDAVLSDLLMKLPDEVPVQCIGADNDEPDEALMRSIGAPVIRLANHIIAQAVRLRASDIHIEHDEKTTSVRYRIDGDLRHMMKVPKAIGEAPLVSRIKIMADLDVADRRRPQDGRAKLRVGGDEICLRVSTIPTSFGEKAVVRILDKRQAQVPLETLGFRPELLSRLTALAKSDQGMLLLTGPTGSGKTTTLYSILNVLKCEDINIVTVEDPIEYGLEGINQVQVNEKAGLTFASVLRSVLRQDPDVVLVGEVRDRETADIAFQAALTGHMVFSTLHTKDAVLSVTRLLDMGVERFKLAPALIGVVSQRLARRVCDACRVEIPTTAAVSALLDEAGLLRRQFKGKGCESCAFSGYKGRIALTELLDLGEQAARDLIGVANGDARLREEALARGWLKPLADDALWHLAHGHVTFEEIASSLEPQSAKSSSCRSAPPAPVRPAEPTARRVLIVDDNPDNRAVMSASIQADGYELSEADGGAAALESIARRKPDLVLLDLMMPEVDGFAVVRKLRGELGIADLPVLIITAMGEVESQELALELGADDYMTKPFNPKVLRARVKALFRRSETPA